MQSRPDGTDHPEWCRCDTVALLLISDVAEGQYEYNSHQGYSAMAARNGGLSSPP